MATIEVRKSCSKTSYRARVRVKGYPQITASFARKTDAKHGNETRAIREERSAKLAELYELEMLGRELGLISRGMVGRKPKTS